MVFTTEGFLKVAIESWPECDLNPSLPFFQRKQRSSSPEKNTLFSA